MLKGILRRWGRLPPPPRCHLARIPGVSTPRVPSPPAATWRSSGHPQISRYTSTSRAFASGPARTCWSCHVEAGPTPFLVCHACRAVQPVDPSVDYFQILGLERKYEVEEGANLEGKYKDWQKKLHPDLVHSKSQKEREFAVEQSALVTEAYRTLTNPLSCAKYILRLEGVELNEEETVSEPELVAEIMEIREAVEDAPDSKALKEIQSLMQQKLRQWSSSFASAFLTRDFGEALACIWRMTYYSRVNEEIVKRL